MKYTWEELVAMKPHILEDWMDGKVRCLIVRSNGSLCAYLGVPLEHALGRFHYDQLSLNCHGGLTFSAEGDGVFFPQGYYWYGWDYAHAGDYTFYNDDPMFLEVRKRMDEAFPFLKRIAIPEKKWLVEDVYEDMQEAIEELKQLVEVIDQADISGLFNNNESKGTDNTDSQREHNVQRERDDNSRSN